MWTFLLAIDCRKFSSSELNVDILCVSWCLLWPSSHKVWNVIVYDDLSMLTPPPTYSSLFNCEKGNVSVYDNLPMLAPPPTFSSLYHLCGECLLTMENYMSSLLSYCIISAVTVTHVVSDTYCSSFSHLLKNIFNKTHQSLSVSEH